MSSDQNQNDEEVTYEFFETIYQYNENDARYSEIDNLTRNISINPNNIRLQQKKAFIISVLVNQLAGSEKFKLLIDLSNCYNDTIELFPQIIEQNLNDKNLKKDYSEDDYRIYGGFKEKSLSQIIEDRNKTIDQIQKIVENAIQIITKLDQEILLDTYNHELYLEKTQYQLILAYQKLEQKQFIEEFQKPIQTFQAAISRSLNHQKYLLQKELEFCEQVLKGLKKDSLEYLDIIFQIMQVYDEQTQVDIENSQLIQEQKFEALRNKFKEYDCNITSESNKVLKKICENCIFSIRKLQNSNKIQQIHTIFLEAKVYLTFSDVFTKNYKLPIEKSIEFQQAQQLYQKIIYILNESQHEFSNELEYLEFKLDLYQDLHIWMGRDIEKIQFQELICQIQELICQITPSYNNLNSLGTIKFQKVYQYERLLEFQKKEDVRIFNKQIIILDKILQLDLNDEKILNSLIIYTDKPISKAIKHTIISQLFLYHFQPINLFSKFNILLKANKNIKYFQLQIKLEALDMSRKFLQNKDIYQIEEICYKLLIEQSNFREVQIAGRLTGGMRGLYVCQTMKNKI